MRDYRRDRFRNRLQLVFLIVLVHLTRCNRLLSPNTVALGRVSSRNNLSRMQRGASDSVNPEPAGGAAVAPLLDATATSSPSWQMQPPQLASGGLVPATMPGAASEPLAAAASWLESLEAGGPMPSREELIILLRSLLWPPVQAPAPAAGPGEARLIQDPHAPTSFPHVVEIAGVPVHPGENNVWHGDRHQREDAQWQQCATKMTRFGLRLVDGQGSMVKGQSPVRLAGRATACYTTPAWARLGSFSIWRRLGFLSSACLAEARLTVRLPSLSRHGVDIHGSTLQQVRAQLTLAAFYRSGIARAET